MSSGEEACAFPGCDRESEPDGVYCATCSSATTDRGDADEVTARRPADGGGWARKLDPFASALVFGVGAGISFFVFAHAVDALGIVSAGDFAFGDYSLAASAALLGGFLFTYEWVTD